MIKIDKMQLSLSTVAIIILPFQVFLLLGITFSTVDDLQSSRIVMGKDSLVLELVNGPCFAWWN